MHGLVADSSFGGLQDLDRLWVSSVLQGLRKVLIRLFFSGGFKGMRDLL